MRRISFDNLPSLSCLYLLAISFGLQGIAVFRAHHLAQSSSTTLSQFTRNLQFQTFIFLLRKRSHYASANNRQLAFSVGSFDGPLLLGRSTFHSGTQSHRSLVTGNYPVVNSSFSPVILALQSFSSLGTDHHSSTTNYNLIVSWQIRTITSQSLHSFIVE